MIQHLVEGVVIDANDPQQLGRLKVWVPSVDGEGYDPRLLPWATLASPLAGTLNNHPAGVGPTASSGLTAYGFWAVPKAGALVIVAFMYGDGNNRVVLASTYPDQLNRSLPVGRNRSDLGNVPLTDTLDPIEPQATNLSQQFGGNLSSSQARTRGAYERSVAQDKTDKDGNEGYQRNQEQGAPTDPRTQGALDPQTYSWTTPGRHAIIMQDHASTGRVRIKTAEGHQVILDDANERIYISTAKGNSWVELDQDGHIHVYGGASVSVSAGKDINLSAGGNINLSAGGNINLGAGGSLLGSACSVLDLTGQGGVHLTSGGQLDVLASGKLIQTGEEIHLNGPEASAGACPAKPSVTPDHEPWDRPASAGARNKNWRA